MRRGAVVFAVLLVLGPSKLGPYDSPSVTPALAAAPRSLILVTLDTTRADRLGTYGSKLVPTPNLDRIAAEGVVFENAESQVPITLASHATLLTGRYPAGHGVRHNGIYRLAPGAATLATQLKATGYDTAAFVGAFVLNRGFGLEQGFDVYDDVAVDRYAGGRDQLGSAQRSADEVNAGVFAWLAARRGNAPFFLWVHYYDPHDPYAPPEKPGRTLQGTGYEREISYVDACFGELVERLRRAGALDASVFVVAGDHGEGLGEHGEAFHGLFLYESTLHVPLFVRAPGAVPAGRRVKGPVELADVAPTALELLGAPPLPAAQGRSLVPRIDGRDDGRYAQAHAESLMANLMYGWAELRSVRDLRFKYVDAPRPELYDLAADPGERTDRAAKDVPRAADLGRAVARWNLATTDATATAGARRTLRPEEEEQLRSLGYVGGGPVRAAGANASLPDPKDRAADLLLLDDARGRLHAGAPARALTLVDKVLARDPRNPDARRTRILALVALKRLPEAEREARAAVVAAETGLGAAPVLVEEARAGLATVYRLEGKSKEAEALYRQMIEANPANDVALTDLAALLLETGRPRDAAALLDALLLKDPRNGAALSTRFTLQAAAHDRAGALRTAEALAEAGRGDPGTLKEAGRLLLEARRPGPAAACFAAAQRALPDLDPELARLTGLARLAEGKPDEARTQFLAALGRSPRDARLHAHLGELALMQDDEDEARRRFAEALRLDPATTRPLVVLARWLERRGRHAEAVAACDDALQRNPADGAARSACDALRTGSSTVPGEHP